MLSPSDKIILTKYPGLPSVCCICNFSANGKREFMDFQMSLDIYGTVAICVDCLAPVAMLLDYVPNSKLIEAVRITNEYKHEVERLQVENESLTSTLDSLFSLKPNLRIDSSLDVKNSASDDIQLEFPIEIERTDNRRSTKSATERRSKNVPQSEPKFDL